MAGTPPASSRWVRRGAAPAAAPCLDELLGASAELDAAELRRVARAGQEDCIKQLLHEVGPGADLNAADEQGRTALWWAAWDGQAAEALLLLERGASLEQVGGRERWTPAMVARLRGHRSLANRLMASADRCAL